MIRKIFSSILLFSFTCALSADQGSMLRELDTIHSIFDNRYAPKEWKESHLGWDLTLQLQNAQKKLKANPMASAKDFQCIVRDFLRSTQDYHVGCRLESTEYSSLPFSVRSVDGRYFIYSVDSKKLDTDSFKIRVGDELISLNEVPVNDIAKEIIAQTGRGVPDTDQALADELITERGGADGLASPKGFVKVKLIDKVTGQPKSYLMMWKHHPEYYTFHREAPPKKGSIFPVKPVMIAADWIIELGSKRKKKHIGDKKSVLPRLGNVVWENESDKIFQAYIFQTPEGENIGFLRIPTYMPEYRDVKEPMEELVDIISIFQENTTQLVIDQTNNGGGMFFYMHEIASLFADEPMKIPKQKIMMTPAFVAEFRMSLKALEHIQTEKQAEEALEGEYFGVKNSLQLVEMMKHYCRFIIDEWESGKNLSGPTAFYGVDQVNPHPKVVYTKPILMLINELDFSCADFFPALMQDNNRAVLMGNRTAGAGGAVFQHHILSNNGIYGVSYTWTIAERSDTKLPIENLGVTPDVIYKPTVGDLQYGYKEYKEAIIRRLTEMRIQPVDIN